MLNNAACQPLLSGGGKEEEGNLGLDRASAPSPSTHTSPSPCAIASVTGHVVSEGKGAREVAQTLQGATVWTLRQVGSGCMRIPLGTKPECLGGL